MTATAFSTPVHLGRGNAKLQLQCVRRCVRPTVRACATANFLTVQQVAEAACERGMELKDESMGPVLTLDLYREGDLQAYISGAVLPKKRLHIEAYKALSRENGALLDVSPGMLVFIGALAFGAAHGCTEVYGLAINDEPKQHERLLRYLKRFGGIEVKKISMRLKDVPNRLLYGGVGMIVKGDIAAMLERSKGMLQRTAPNLASTKP